MRSHKRLSLLDGDCQQRASISHFLANAGFKVEPFESVEDLFSRDRDAIPLLLFDNDEIIPKVLERMVRAGSWMPMIAFGERIDTRRVLEAGRFGVADYLQWPFTVEQLDQSLAWAECLPRAALDGRQRTVAAQERLACLSAREQEVLAWVAAGLRNHEIGNRLGISSRTVERHRANLLEKLGVGSTPDAVRLAADADLVVGLS
jgi:FixJ family two-component response regulator